MSLELWLLAASAMLGLVQIGLASATQRRLRGRDWYAGSRDAPVPPLTGLAGRLERALKNYGETFPIFAVAVLAAETADRHGFLTLLGANLYLWGRLAYVPLYAFGRPRLRSAAWGVATLGILVVLIGLV